MVHPWRRRRAVQVFRCGDVQSLKLLCGHGGWAALSQYVILWLLWQPANLQRPTEGMAAVGLWLRAAAAAAAAAAVQTHATT